MKKAILILLTVLLAVSCSQVVYDNLPPVEIGGKYSTTLTATQDGTSTALKLRFNAVPYIAQYGYDINGSDIEAIPDSEIKIVNGNYEFKIDADIIGNQYNGEIYLYGKVPSDVGTEEWVNIGSTEYSIAVEGTAPVVNLYARNETEAVLYLDAPPAGMIYKVVVKDSSGNLIDSLSKTDLLPESGNEKMLYVCGLEKGQSYTFDVYQKKIGDENDYPTVCSSVYVGPFTNEVKLVLSEEKNIGFVVEIAEDLSGISAVTLVNDTTNKDLVTVDVTGNFATFAYDQIPSLESGLFYAKTISAGEEYISNYVDTITPITVLEMTPNYRSVDLKVKFSDQITDPAIDITLSTPGIPSTFEYIEQEDGTYLLVINGLNSNTSYSNLNLRATVKSERVIIIIDAFKTQSFANKYYKWEGDLLTQTNKNFIIYVADAPIGSEYMYYVYFSGNDAIMTGSDKTESYSKSKYRIMPLVDNSQNLINADPVIEGYVSTGDGMSLNGIDFSLQNAAYGKNESKWKQDTFLAQSFKTKSWMIDADLSTIEDDFVETITKTSISSAEPSIGTSTSFSFCEIRYNGEVVPYVRFENKAYNDSMAKIGLEKNHKTTFPTYLSDENIIDGYVWALGLVEDAEGDVE